MSTKPIGIFDSGLGGITVLKALIEKMPNESFVYLGDTARLPYGSKSPQTILKYLQQNIQLLKSYDVKAIVVACNSASSVVDDHVKTSLNIPLFEVIGPGSQKAFDLTKNKRIGVIGTRATVSQHAYGDKLKSLCTDLEVFEVPCPLFVPFIEEGLVEDPLTNLLVYRYVNGLSEHQVDTLILGCTHYPFLKPNIQKVMGPDVTLVDSAESVSEEVFRSLAKSQILTKNKSSNTKIKILCTDINDNYKDQINNFLLPFKTDDIQLADL